MRRRRDDYELDSQTFDTNLAQIATGVRVASGWLRRYRWFILAGGIVGAVIGFYLQSRKPPIYGATLSFMVNERMAGGGGGGGLAGIAGQLGLRIGGGTKDGINLDRIVALSKSSDIIWRALSDTLEIGGEPSTLREVLAATYTEEIDRLRPLMIPVAVIRDDDATFPGVSPIEHAEDAALLKLTMGQAGSPGLYSVGYEEDSGVISVAAETLAPEISVALCHAVYAQVQHYYTEQASSQPQLLFSKASRHTDSIRNALNAKEIQLARNRDSRQQMLLNEGRVPVERLQRELSILSILYAEAIKHLEDAKFALSSSLPAFQVLELPEHFILAPARGRVKATLVGMVGGILLSLLLAVVDSARRLLRRPKVVVPAHE